MEKTADLDHTGRRIYRGGTLTAALARAVSAVGVVTLALPPAADNQPTVVDRLLRRLRPRTPRARVSRYVPHQGARECARRRRQLVQHPRLVAR